MIWSRLEVVRESRIGVLEMSKMIRGRTLALFAPAVVNQR